MSVSVIDTRESSSLFRTLEMTKSGHSGFSSLKLGASWSVGDDDWMPHQQVLTISRQLYAILVVTL